MHEIVLYIIMGVFTVGWAATRPPEEEEDMLVKAISYTLIAVVWPAFLGKFVGDHVEKERDAYRKSNKF